MAYDEKTLKRDGSGITPVPQHFNPTADDYEAILGRNGASRVELYGPDGNPISTSSGKLAVRATEIESLLNDIKGKDYATGAKQTALAALIGEVQASPTANTLLARLKSLEDKIDILDGVLDSLNDIKGKDYATGAKQTALAALIGEVDADPTANTLLARLKSLEDKIDILDGVLDSIVDGSAPAVTQLSGSNFEEVRSNVNIITTKHKQASEYDIYGVRWDKCYNPTLTRTDDATGLVANAGVGFESVKNDFDKLPIFGEIEDVVDSYGNVFVKIPKLYIRKVDGANFKSWQVSKRRYPGFYLPWCFWDFINEKELPYILVGKHKASLSADNKLESKPNTYPLINKTIVDFRTYARNNNDSVNGLLGYQQLDIHVVDVLRTLFFVEFATLDAQSVMQGYSSGRYGVESDLATVSESATNRIIVSNATAAEYLVGQTISIGTARYGTQVFYGRTITAIEDYDVDNKSIVFDGDPVDITVGNFLQNTGWKNGFSSNILASSGSLIANDGKYPCVYRGIESPFGDVWQFVDGVNINDRQAWVALNAEDYASNVFAYPYEQLGYTNHNADGYVKEMGFDPNFPFAEFSVAISNSVTHYKDYYYQDAGQRIARFGGYWGAGAHVGLSSWYLHFSSSTASVTSGGRLLKKPQGGPV